MSRLIDHFPSWASGTGIFAGMTGVPWTIHNDSGITAQSMDNEYFGNRSGLRESSPLLEKMTAFPDDHEISAAEIATLQAIIVQKFAANWERVYQALLKSYEPLENYSMTETTTPGITKKIAVNTSESITNGSTGSVYGFNSTQAVPATAASGTSGTTGLKANNYSEESYTGYDTHTRSGNIGVTTSQQMLEAELSVRRQTFLETVYSDVDTILTRPSWR